MQLFYWSAQPVFALIGDWVSEENPVNGIEHLQWREVMIATQMVKHAKLSPMFLGQISTHTHTPPQKYLYVFTVFGYFVLFIIFDSVKDTTY